MDYWESLPPPGLASVVRCFWFLRGDLAHAPPQAIVPDGRLEIILHLAEPFSRLETDGTVRRQGSILLSGQLTGPIHLQSNGVSNVVGIRFRTTGAAAILRTPLDELTDRVDSLQALAPGLATSLYDSAARLWNPPEIVAALSRVLVRFLVRPPDRLAATVIGALDSARPPRIADLAGRLGVSVRTLERSVAKESGLRPSLLQRVLRFRRAFRLVETTPRTEWTRIALRAGYYDQSHLIRDFGQFAGAAPTEFFRQGPELARAMVGRG